MAINMRKVTEAVLTPKSVKEEHLDDLAISERTIQPDAVNTDSLQDAVVTLAKSADDVRLHQFVGEESEVQVTGDVYEIVKITKFIKHIFSPVIKIRVLATLKTDDIANTASFAIYIDDDVKLELTSTEIDYELVNGEFDTSGLANGKHSLDVRLKSSDAAGIAYSDLVDILMVK